mgnify:FL=1
MGKVIASWSVDLFADCPACECLIDLTEYDNEAFMNGERGSPLQQMEDVEITCPECEHEFKCDFYW